MPFETFNIGTAPNDGTGDPLRTAFSKVGTNFAKPALLPYGVPSTAPAANQVAYYSAANAVSYANLTTFGRSLIDDADAAAARATLDAPSRTAPSQGVADMNNAPLGQWVSYNGTADQGVPMNWPSVGSAGGSQQWWNVFSYGPSNRITQIATFGFASSYGRTFIRAKHDSTWSAWREVLLSPASGTVLPLPYTLQLADGTKAVPALSFSSDGNSGIYRVSENTIGIAGAGQDVVRFVGDGSDVNYWQFKGSNAGASVRIEAQGTDANISLNQNGKGTGGVLFGNGNGTQFEVVGPAASTVNRIRVAGAAAGARPSFTAFGADGNLGIDYVAKGTGQHLFTNQNGASFAIGASTASLVNYLRAAGGPTGDAPQILAEGSDTNVTLKLTPKGTGSVDASSKRITSVATPTATDDAATKDYVDNVWRLDRTSSADLSAGSNPSNFVVTFPVAGESAAGLSWDATNHRCTPTEAGTYLFTGTVSANITIASAVLLSMRKNGAEFGRILSAVLAAGQGAGTSFALVAEANGTTDYFDVIFSAPAGGACTILGATATTIRRFQAHRITRST